MVEFALTGFLFLAVVVVTLESAVAGFRALSAQYLASEGVRRGILSSDEFPLLSVDQLKAFIVARADSLGVSVAVADIEICGYEFLQADGTCSSQNMGSSEGFLSVRLTTHTPFFLGTMNLNLLGEAFGRIEKR